MFRHVTLYLAHWASNATAAIEISQNAHQNINGDTLYND